VLSFSLVTFFFFVFFFRSISWVSYYTAGLAYLSLFPLPTTTIIQRPEGACLSHGAAPADAPPEGHDPCMTDWDLAARHNPPPPSNEGTTRHFPLPIKAP